MPKNITNRKCGYSLPEILSPSTGDSLMQPVEKRPSAWWDARFHQTESKLATNCSSCSKTFWLPPSKHGKYHSCSPECMVLRRTTAALPLWRKCETCNSDFKARHGQINQGQGKFCSRACNTAVRAANKTPEALEKRSASMKRRIASGEYKHRTGSDHPHWVGGPEFHQGPPLQGTERYAKALLAQRIWRHANPEKVREQSQTRRGRKTGRLPKGTVFAQGESQAWRCIYCWEDIESNYHMDHRMPLALGGKHEANNIQLLCPTCNVRKSARHPEVAEKLLGKYRV